MRVASSPGAVRALFGQASRAKDPVGFEHQKEHFIVISALVWAEILALAESTRRLQLLAHPVAQR